jgi:predicted nucleic acid-binding protein
MQSNQQETVPAFRYAVSNTGPMLSVFQSEQTDLLKFLYDRIYIPTSELAEYRKHGAETLIWELLDCGFVVVCELNQAEKEEAKRISEEIANHHFTKDKLPQNHYPEAEAMVLASRPELETPEILLDERAAREIAKVHGLPIIGFAGLLIRACQAKLMTPEEVREIMLKCVALGTHYAEAFIENIYKRLQEYLNEP